MSKSPKTPRNRANINKYDIMCVIALLFRLIGSLISVVSKIQSRLNNYQSLTFLR
jgi:hypothetical protein